MSGAGSPSFGGIREYLLPSPLSVWNSLWHGEVSWAQHLWVTTWEIVGAFVMAGAVGVALGVAIAWSQPKTPKPDLDFTLEKKNPVTHLKLNNDPADFQFDPLMLM